MHTAVFVGVGLLACLWLNAAQAAQSRKPNVIIIFTDDQGYEDLGVFGSPKIRTPNIDQMAREGMRFTDFYSASSVCTPSRAALLTGCYPGRVGGLGVLFPKDQKGLNPEETTIARMLKANGYATACIGKWHLGHLKEFLPTSHGFDSYYGIPYSNDMTIAQGMSLASDLVLREGVTLETIWEAKKNWVPLMRNQAVIEYPADQSTLTQRYTREAILFITQHRDTPFFLYMPHTMPHIPLYASPEFEGKSEVGLYGDCIEEIDWSVGQILKTLKAQGLDRNTLIIYTSDNGPWNLKGNATDKVKGNMNRRIGGSALPLRGYKFQTWEGGMREPTVMRWPGRIPAGKVCREVAGTIDVLPTIAALSPGATLPDKKVDGKSIVPLLEARPGATTPHAAYFYRTEAVRAGHWKLKKDQLFDLSRDMSEQTNVAQDHPDIVARLTTLLNEHKQELKRNKRPHGKR
ncbi:MAG: sulfatase [Planctomycetes bacterium]|nr:sulfatase [Planctomycetota bacterium]